MDRNFYLHLLVKAAQNRHQSIHREAAQVRITDTGEIRRSDPSYVVRFANREFTLIENTDNLRRQAFVIGL